MFAKNEEEQQSIYQLVDDYVTAKTDEGIGSTPNSQKRFISKKNLVWVRLAGLFLVLITALIFYLVQLDGPNNIPISERAENPTPSNPLPTAKPADDSDKPGDDSDKVEPNTPTPPINNDTPKPFSYKIAYTQPITPQKKNINLQVSGFLGIILGAVLFNLIFFQTKKVMEREERVRHISDESTDAEHWTGEEGQSVSEQFMEELEPVSLTFPPKNYLIHRTREFNRIKTALKKPLLIEGETLNIRRSIYASTRKAGFVSLEFDEHTVLRQFVVLIEGNRDAHLTQLFDYLIHFLQAEKLQIRKYFYVNDIKALSDESGKWVSFAELSNEVKELRS
ncbi:MAG: hypothetical protein EOP04_12310, partial [Proteobacteria bacterium]